MSHKSWCFTLNNYTEEECLKWQAIECSVKWIGKEVGDSGTPHLQGCIVFRKSIRMAKLKELFPRANFSALKDTEWGPNYCLKENLWCYVDNRKPGSRTDIHEFQAAILAGDTNTELHRNHGSMMMRYPNYPKRLRMDTVHDVHQFKWGDKRQCFYIYGPTGVGKSKAVMDIFYPNLVKVKYVNKFMMHYDGHSIVFLDEFKGQIEYNELLELTDPYQPTTINVKGGEEAWNAKTFVITSSSPPEQWYTCDLSELHRRIKVYQFPRDYDECVGTLQWLKWTPAQEGNPGQEQPPGDV